MIIGDTILAYMAGIVDGEGSIIIYRRKSKKYKPKVGQMKVVVSNTDRTLMDFLQLYFGGSIATDRHREKPCYLWTVASKKALCFLEAIEPFIRVKKLQAQVAIEFQHKRLGQGCRPTEEGVAVAEAQRIIMQGLNKKGGVRL